MQEAEEEVTGELPLEGVGQMLRRVREEQGISIERIAELTRIPVRHLEVIERGEFSKLPARTYAVGFSRTYARMVGLDEHEAARKVRAELTQSGYGIPENRKIFEPGDPAKLPSRGLAWASAIGALILLVGAGAFFAQRSGIGVGPDPITPDATEMAAQPAEPASRMSVAEAAPPLAGSGQVVFTALEDGVWVRFYDAGGRRLMEKQMAVGERFEIPSDAQSPRIWTGRPDAFAITIDGRAVPKLAERETVMRDVAISAEALLARNEAGEGSAVN